MATDQQFCLRWNNHQSTLISVFDSLLENGTLVDCTLAAEGQYLKAHKVVLSACSPYLETLLSQHYEKHPIVILKDVKFSELKSMMDYMYRGEVNICQDQLGTFLKAAESLQIKGLSDNGDDARDVGSTAPKRQDPPRPSVTQTRTPVENKRPVPTGDSSDASRDGSISPSSLRKRRRTRRPSQGDDPDSHLENNACDLPSAQSTPLPVSVPNTSIVPTPVQNLPKQIVKQEPSSIIASITESGLKKEIMDPPTEPLLEPKTEYLDYMNNENSIEVEDLTLDDDDDLDSSMDASRPGPSHGDMSNQGYPPWPMTGDQSGTDEIFMAAQEAVGAASGQQRDSQDTNEDKEKGSMEQVNESLVIEDDTAETQYYCPACNVLFDNHPTFHAHECEQEPVSRSSVKITEEKHLLKDDDRNKLEATLKPGPSSMPKPSNRQPLRPNTILVKKDFKGTPSHSSGKHSKRSDCEESLDTDKHKPMKEESPKKQFDCLRCQKSYKLKRSLVKHNCKPPLEESILEKPFECSVCKKRFKKNYTLTHHSCVPPSLDPLPPGFFGDPPYLCSGCGKSFSHKSTFSRHIHHECGKGTRTSVLGRGPPYVCKRCGISIKHKSTYCRHVRHICGKGKCFPRLSGPPYTCFKCGKVFEDKNRIYSHRYVCGLGPKFPCKLCPKAFTKKITLTKHLDRFHPPCLECEERFASKPEFEYHIQLGHLNVGSEAEIAYSEDQ